MISDVMNRAIIATLLSTTLPCAADVLLVPEDHATVQEAMSVAVPGDIIDLAAGIWTNQQVWGLSDVTLRGRDDPEGTTIIDGSMLEWSPVVCYGGPCTIENITFRNGVGSNVYGLVRGGAIYAEFSQITIRNCRFESNRVEMQEFDLGAIGGAICGYYSDLLIEDCDFEGNHSDELGGAVYSTSASMLEITNCTFIDNQAEMYGGGIATNSTSMLVANCMFNGNFAGGYGAGIYSHGSTDEQWAHSSTVDNCIFRRNSASWAGYGMGGGIAIQYFQTMDVSNSVFEDNYGYVAGAICGGGTEGGTVNLATSVFCGNSLNDFWGDVVDDGTNTFQQSCWCSADADNDGVVAIGDLLVVIGSWNSFNPDADTNNDGFINVGDLLDVISAWGRECSGT